jgi:hypothetical protein
VSRNIGYMPHSDLEERRAYARSYYERNKESYLASNRRNRDRRVAELAVIVAGIKNQPCADCGQRFPPYVMDFDHPPGTKKIAAVSRLVWDGSTRVLLAEIAKCDLVCSNCHRIRTWERTHKGTAPLP